MKNNSLTSPETGKLSDDLREAIPPLIAARGIYTLLLGALLVAKSDETPGAAERRRAIALVAEAYFPLTGLEKPSWFSDAFEVRAIDADGVCLDQDALTSGSMVDR